MVADEVVVVGCQSGDEGKGKFTDIFSDGADVVARWQGGPHTGHTVVADGREYRFVQLPAGMQRGARAILGNGCVVEPAALLEELEDLGLAPGHDELLISEVAHVVMPWHPLQDAALERWRGGDVATGQGSGMAVGEGQLGSTKRGVGPCREDKIARIGLRLVDLLDRDVLRARLQLLVPLKVALLERVFGMSPREHALAGVDALTDRYHGLGRRLAPWLGDAAAALRAARRDAGLIVYEGAQSLALDVEHGTYPYCSSGFSGAGGVTVGTGSPPGTPFTVAGVAKAYMAQVGGGPLPTELGGAVADYLVDRGREVGTVTGRRRRVGWFDMAFARKTVAIDGVSHLCLTNLDVLAGLPEVKVATHYRVDGERCELYPPSLAKAARVEPVLETFAGWPDADWERSADAGYEALPPNARRFAEYLADGLGVRLAAVSFGRHRDRTIVLDSPVRARQAGAASAREIVRS